MTGTEKPAQILFQTTEIGGSVKYSMGIENPFRTDTENCTDPTIKPTAVHFNQATKLGHIDWKHFLLGSLDSGTYVTRYGRNIDNHTEMNPQTPIVTTIPESSRSNNCNIFDSDSRTSGLAYRGFPRHEIMKSESENPVENLRDKNNSKNAERENNSEAAELVTKIL